MLQEDEAFDVAVLVEHSGDALGERETRDRVRHIRDAIAEHFARHRLAVRLIGQREHRRRMRVVDHLVRQEGVQQRFDRGIGRGGIEQIHALEIDHVLVGQLVERAQTAERRQPHGRQTGGLDVAHVPARTLDADHFDRVAEQVRHVRLDRRVAAAVQHELRIAAQKTCGVDALRQILAHAFGGVAFDEASDVGVGPAGFHGAVPVVWFVETLSCHGRQLRATQANRVSLR